VKDLTALDWAGILFIGYMLTVHYVALSDEPYVVSGIGLQNGVLQVTEAGK